MTSLPFDPKHVDLRAVSPQAARYGYQMSDSLSIHKNQSTVCTARMYEWESIYDRRGNVQHRLVL